MRISRLVGVSAVVSALCMVATASASADTTSCTISGSIKLSPGLSETAQIQNISIKGTVSGCSGEESTVTEGTYNAHLKTTEPVTCAALHSVGEATTGTIGIKWAKGPKPPKGTKPPKEAKSSSGTFTMPLTEAAATLGGTIEKGQFEGDTIGGSVSQTYTGSATCGEPGGKKVNKGSLSGTLSIT